MVHYLTDIEGNQIAYSGIGPEGGRLPAFFYFALSKEESLGQEPYNHPVLPLVNSPLRIFSFTLPGHGPGFDKFHAMQYWADQIARGDYLLESFFEETISSIQWLIDEGLVDPDHLAVGGLSRGAFIATHLAALDPRIRIVLGFAPLTRLSSIEEFDQKNTFLMRRAQELDLERVIDKLTHLHHLLFYISNRDSRVSTDACYHFIRQLAETVHEKRARRCSVELRITSPIGHKGHGTSPATFEEGSAWIKQLLTGG